MNFFCIADPESSLGFRLAGVETREASTKTEAVEALQVARSIPDIGIILVTGKVAAFIEAEIEEHLYEGRLPLILEIPSKGMPFRRKTISEVLKKTIGISV